MNQIWTLHIENFARVKETDIKVAPLMCFIGDNNSGKSYIMSLLWGIMSNEDFFHRQKKFELESYKSCKEFILNHIGEEVEIGDDIAQLWIIFFNDLLNSCKESLVKEIFNRDMSIGKLEIRNFTRLKKLFLEIKRTEREPRINFGQYISIELSLHEPNGKDKIGNDQISINLPMNGSYIENALWRATVAITFSLIMLDWLTVLKTTEDARPIYLPASRTGFLLTYPQIAGNSVGVMFSSKPEERLLQNTLTLPYIQFLQFLIALPEITSRNSSKLIPSSHRDLIRFISEKILHGTVTMNDADKAIRYQASDMTEELPMSVTSAVVTETASLLLLLTTKIPLRLVIIEEPEAHLHPDLQKKIAQLLIRFVHSGIPIWITTHSDTIIHHFNNMLKLNSRSEDEKKALMTKFDYEENDLLNSAEVNMYQFKRDDRQTIIEKLSAGRYGFKATSFNEAIDDLTEEIFAFQEDD